MEIKKASEYRRAEAYFASGFCLGLSWRKDIPFEEGDREILRCAAVVLKDLLDAHPEYLEKKGQK